MIGDLLRGLFQSEDTNDATEETQTPQNGGTSAFPMMNPFGMQQPPQAQAQQEPEQNSGGGGFLGKLLGRKSAGSKKAPATGGRNRAAAQPNLNIQRPTQPRPGMQRPAQMPGQMRPNPTTIPGRAQMPGAPIVGPGSGPRPRTQMPSMQQRPLSPYPQMRQNNRVPNGVQMYNGMPNRMRRPPRVPNQMW